MNLINSKQTIGQMVAERPSRSRVFERRGLDYCCGGKKDLETACREKALDPADVLQELYESDTHRTDTRAADWTTAPLHDLIDHIVRAHHGYLRDALPRLTHLITKVNAAHGDRHAELEDLAATFAALRHDLEEHTRQEETVLFPLIERIEAASPPDSIEPEAIHSMIRSLEKEHDQAGAELAKIRALTNDYTPPSSACNTYRAMLDGLAELEADMHRHVHKENSILFPRAAEIEAILTAL